MAERKEEVSGRPRLDDEPEKKGADLVPGVDLHVSGLEETGDRVGVVVWDEKGRPNVSDGERRVAGPSSPSVRRG